MRKAKGKEREGKKEVCKTGAREPAELGWMELKVVLIAAGRGTVAVFTRYLTAGPLLFLAAGPRPERLTMRLSEQLWAGTRCRPPLPINSRRGFPSSRGCNNQPGIPLFGPICATISANPLAY